MERPKHAKGWKGLVCRLTNPWEGKVSSRRLPLNHPRRFERHEYPIGTEVVVLSASAPRMGRPANAYVRLRGADEVRLVSVQLTMLEPLRVADTVKDHRHWYVSGD